MLSKICICHLLKILSETSLDQYQIQWQYSTHWAVNLMCHPLQITFEIQFLEWINIAVLSLKYHRKIDNKSASVQVMTWCHAGHKPVTAPIVTEIQIQIQKGLLKHIHIYSNLTCHMASLVNYKLTFIGLVSHASENYAVTSKSWYSLKADLWLWNKMHLN